MFRSIRRKLFQGEWIEGKLQGDGVVMSTDIYVGGILREHIEPEDGVDEEFKPNVSRVKGRIHILLLCDSIHNFYIH